MARLYRRSRKKTDASKVDKLAFLLNGERVELEDVDPALTVLDFLRQIKGLNGTKNGCNEGECGACTVVIGEMRGSSVHYQAVISCITFLGALHSKHLITVEGVQAKGKLHPAQQVILANHASQCGFCTPGVVMSLYALCANKVVDRPVEDIDDALVGNHCRCTGYDSILSAAHKLVKRKNLSSFSYDHQKAIAEIKKTSYKTAQTFKSKHTEYFSPTTADELAQLIQKHKNATLVAGGTDVGVLTNKGNKRPVRIISLERVNALRMIRKGKDMFTIGAGATLNEARQVLAADYPDLDELLRRFGNQQIRNRATVIGNLASADEHADLPPAFIVLDAKITMRVGNFRRFLKLEDYYLKKGKQDIKSGEFIETLQIPRKLKSSVFQVYKLSKRHNQDVSTLCGAFYLRLDSENIVRDIRVCFTGLGSIPKRAEQLERALIEEKWSLQTISKSIVNFKKDFQPVSDCRGTDEYKMIAAINLLKRFFLQTQSGSIQTQLPGRHRA